MLIAFAPAGYERFSILDNPLKVPMEEPAPPVVERRKAEAVGNLPPATPQSTSDKENCSPRNAEKGTPFRSAPRAPSFLSRMSGTGSSDAVRLIAEMSASQGFDITAVASPDPDAVTQRYGFGKTDSRPAMSLLA